MRAMDRVYLKRVNNALQNPTYNLTLFNIIWPIMIQVLTLGYMVPYVLIMRWRVDRSYSWKFFLPNNPAASKIGKVTLLQLGLFSLGDQLNAALQAIPSAFISQTMMSVMTNLNIPFVVVLSIYFLKARYSQVHYIGCVLIAMSVLVGLSTKMSSNNCTEAGMENDLCLMSYQSNDGQPHLLGAGTVLLWYGIFILGVLPGAAGNVYKQHVLQSADCDIVYATFWSGNFQILWGFLCVPLMWLHIPGQDISPGQTFQAIADTLSCMGGNVPHPGDESCAVSPTPWFWFVIYLIFNLSFNLLQLWLVKYLSATWTQIATVLCLDLTNIFGMIPFIAGGGAQMMSLNDWLATVLASIALWTYNQQPEKRDQQQSKSMEDYERQGSEASSEVTV